MIKLHSDEAYLIALAVTAGSAIFALLTSCLILLGRCYLHYAAVLGICCAIGPLSATASQETDELFWLPPAANGFFTSILSAAILGCLCRILRQTEGNTNKPPR